MLPATGLSFGPLAACDRSQQVTLGEDAGDRAGFDDNHSAHVAVAHLPSGLGPALRRPRS
jgi:hypothetical protein